MTDGLVVYQEINNTSDSEAFQKNMDPLSNWEGKWGMKFHPDRCETITITCKRKFIDIMYNLKGHELKKTNENPNNLGVNIKSNLDWKQHITNNVKKANKTIGFLKCNLKQASEEVRTTAYKTIVRPQLEYCKSTGVLR